jgi:hypothetical protein
MFLGRRIHHKAFLSPREIRSDALLVAPALLVLLFMLFWLWRVLATRRTAGPLDSVLVC